MSALEDSQRRAGHDVEAGRKFADDWRDLSRPGDHDQQQVAEDPYAEYRQWVSNDRPGCACGGPCEHDGSIALERAFHDGYDAALAAARADGDRLRKRIAELAAEWLTDGCGQAARERNGISDEAWLKLVAATRLRAVLDADR